MNGLGANCGSYNISFNNIISFLICVAVLCHIFLLQLCCNFAAETQRTLSTVRPDAKHNPSEHSSVRSPTRTLGSGLCGRVKNTFHI